VGFVEAGAGGGVLKPRGVQITRSHRADGVLIKSGEGASRTLVALTCSSSIGNVQLCRAKTRTLLKNWKKTTNG
jgi:hypothetical protein